MNSVVKFGVDFEVNSVWIFPSLRFLMRHCAFFACMTVFFTLRFWHCAGLLRGVDIPARSSALQRAQARSCVLQRTPANSSALALRSVSHARAPREAKRARICQWERWRSTECRGYLVGAGPMRRQQGAKGDQLGESGRCSEIAVAGLMFAAVG